VPYTGCSIRVSFTVSEQPSPAPPAPPAAPPTAPQVPQWLWIAIAAGAGVAIIGAVVAVMYSESSKS
jgi:uncharacterized protein involved in exopolysaccharide biosynthesis